MGKSRDIDAMIVDAARFAEKAEKALNNGDPKAALMFLASAAANNNAAHAALMQH